MSSKIWINMICEKCFREKDDKDFLNNNMICFKCIYELKMKSSNPSIAKNVCRICSKKFYGDKNAKKRQRNVFCSEECALKGHKELSNNHWTRKLRKNPSVNL